MWGSRSSGSAGGGMPKPPATSSSGAEVIIVPRNFKLLEELESKEHGAGDPAVSFGLTQPDDIFLTDWNATIFGPQATVHDMRVYQLRVHCGEKYPDEPPSVRFVSRINLTCVDQNTGEVTNRLPVLANWHRHLGIEQVLVELKKEMTSQANRRLPQPPEGSTFP